jgi:DNA polymerase III delta subunit
VSLDRRSVVLVVGTDRFEATAQFAAERDELAAHVDPSVGVDEFSGDDPDLVGRALDAARTPAMFGGHRLVVLRDGLSDATAPLLQAFVAEPAIDATVLALHLRGGGATPKWLSALITAVRDHGGLVVESKGPPDRAGDLAGWITTKAKQHGVTLRADAAAYIAAHVGADAGAIASLLDQLDTAYPDTVIGEPQVSEFVRGPSVSKTWDLTDAIDSGDTPGALRRLHGLLVDMHPMQVHTALVNHVRRITAARSLEPSSPVELERALGLKSYPAKKLFGVANRISSDAALAAHRTVTRADVAVRGGSGLEPAAVLEVVVVTLTSQLGRAGRTARR